jgi:hypothetical protein
MFDVSVFGKFASGLRTVATSALLLAAYANGATAAADTPNWYATGAFGLVTQSDQQLTFTRPGVSGAVTPTIPLDTGFLAGGSIGRYFGEDWRIEAEFMYQSVDHPVFTLVAGGPGLPSGDGNYASTSIALNALREFDLFGSPRVKTYAGLGAVYATEIDLDFESGGVENSFSGSGTGVQALIGARYNWGERAFVDTGVRYLLVSSAELDGEEGAVGRIKADYEPLAVTVAFGWRF